MLFEYMESLDYAILPGFSKLNEEQQQQIHSEFERGYTTAKSLGLKVAMGKGHETARLALEELQKNPPKSKTQAVPPSIFAGLENCQ